MTRYTVRVGRRRSFWDWFWGFWLVCAVVAGLQALIGTTATVVAVAVPLVYVASAAALRAVARSWGPR